MTDPGIPITARSGAGLFAGPETGGTPSRGAEPGGPTAPGAGSPLRGGLLVSRARAAARSGDLDEALRLLRSADDPAVAGHRDALDLLARLHAQRGEPAEAAAYWRRVLERHPQDRDAAAGLARIERLARGGPRAALARHRTRTALIAAVCAVTAVTAGMFVTTGDGAESDRGAGAGQAVQEDPAESAAERSGRQREEDRAAAAARRTAELTTLARGLRAPGLRTVVRADVVEVVFAEGLFSEGAELTPTGAGRLAALGERLTGRRVHVTIHGHAATVPGAPRSGGSVVALWRALIAARELSAASGKPLTEFTTASADQRAAPYGSAARNRTVTVLVAPE